MNLDRRRFLKHVGALTLSTAAASPLTKARAARAFSSDPFSSGIASGYPHSGGVTLWTRLNTQSVQGDPQAAFDVIWEVAEDEGFRRISRNGKARATALWGHSIHVDVEGLEASRPYWYRFRAGDVRSPVGRTRTAPRPDDATPRFRYAFAACQQYEQGYYAAFRHMAREDLDLVVHLGDYIYESSWGRSLVRSHASPEPYTLDEYRARFALYKSDPDLQAAHAAFPWLVTWDDHEVDNDYANDRSQDLDPPEVFLARRAAAYQAYYENMPLPQWARPRRDGMRLHTSVRWGDLASLYVLDTRQYRSHQVCPRPGRGGSTTVREEECPERLNPALSLLGREQERWLDESLARSQSGWNVVAQQTLVAQADRRPGPGADFWTDGWDGYPRARERLLRSLSRREVRNPLVISGDVHTATVANLHADADDPRSPVVATEFVCPSITSQGPSQQRVELLLGENPHILFANGVKHGYATVELTPWRCTTRMRVVGHEKDRDTPIRTLATYTVEDGRPGAQRG